MCGVPGLVVQLCKSSDYYYYNSLIVDNGGEEYIGDAHGDYECRFEYEDSSLTTSYSYCR